MLDEEETDNNGKNLGNFLKLLCLTRLISTLFGYQIPDVIETPNIGRLQFINT